MLDPGAAGRLVLPIELTPAAAFAACADDPHVVWLDSGGPTGPRSRYSYVAADPFEVIAGDAPFAALAAAMARFSEPADGLPVPFGGGAMGFLGYELGASLEHVPRHAGPAWMPGSSIGLYDVVLAFDRLTGAGWLLSSGLPEQAPGRRAARAAARAAWMLARLAVQPARGAAAPVTLDWRAETSRAAHEARVARTVAWIEAGDIYQANITAAFHAARPAGVAAGDLFLALRTANPAPFSAFVRAGPGCAVASVSPERFIGLDAAGGIEARPIKGTRARDSDPARDAALLAELLGSEKDRAENLMIVDLLRHDIARVAAVGSVHVPELAVAESFAHVHHLVSCVRGRLREGFGAVDLLRAAFPGGSVTGAPKIRAQEIIHALEPAARGPYCGSVLWLGWDGAMDSSIAIRTATVTPDRVSIHAGGGIVADSDPAAEYEEMMVKVRPLLRALGPWAE